MWGFSSAMISLKGQIDLSPSIFLFFLQALETPLYLLFALRVLPSCCCCRRCLFSPGVLEMTSRQCVSFSRSCFRFQFVTMAAAATSCRSGSSCVHSFSLQRSHAACLHYHIWGFVNNGRRASPNVKQTPSAAFTHRHSRQALVTPPVGPQLPPLTVEWDVNVVRCCVTRDFCTKRMKRVWLESVS